MKALMKLACLSFAVGVYVGCSPVKFDLDESQCVKVGQNCIVQNGKYHFDNEVTVGGNKVDILIVNDNSASMSFEQKNLANRFNGFISQLESNAADYRIAVTTTDISSTSSNTTNNPARAINQNGALMDGNLINFGSSPFLTKASANTLNDRVAMFNQVIVRPETLQCENFIANWYKSGKDYTSAGYSQGYFDNCPSGDERGIFAASLTMKNNPSGFVRSDANLAIIFLSDEDVRSALHTSPGYALSESDTPNNLITTIKAQYGDAKNMSFHAIVVKDDACLNVQNTQKLGNPAVNATQGIVSGSKGNIYLTFPNQGLGKAVDICFNDYTSQLGQISTSIIEQINSVTIACPDPQNLQVDVQSSDASITWTHDATHVRFNKTLPLGTKVRLTYDCGAI